MVPVSKKPSAKIIHPKENTLSQCGWYNLFHSRYNTMLQVSHQWLEILRARGPISFPGSLSSDLKVAGRSVICPTTRTTGTRDPRDPGKQRSREPREPENHMNHENYKNQSTTSTREPQEPENDKNQSTTRTSKFTASFAFCAHIDVIKIETHCMFSFKRAQITWAFVISAHAMVKL